MASDRSSPAAQGSLIHNPAAGRYRPLRSPGAVRAAAPALSNVRHRSPNPAIVAGASDLSKRSSGAIDGKQVTRRL
ncbi:MAG: hypothetical protein WAM39_10765 [Bryobacteraceae bacterium]